MEQKTLQIKDNKEEDVNLRQLFEQYAFYWKWFVLSIFVALGVAVLYLRYAQKTYSTTAKILLKDERSASAGELAGIAELNSSMGFGGNRFAFVTDQIEVLSSRRLMRKVVDRYHLNIKYAVKGKIRSMEILEKDMPFILEPQGDQDTIKLNIKVQIDSKQQLHVTNIPSSEQFSFGFDKLVKIGKNTVIFRRIPKN